MSNNIYLAFYSRQADTKADWSVSNLVTEFLWGPFVHVQLCFDRCTNGVRCLNISEKVPTATYGVYTFTREGYSFLKIPVTFSQMENLRTLAMTLDSKKNYLKRSELYSCCKNYNCSVDRPHWFCSSMITFLLQEVKLLPRTFSPVDTDELKIYLNTHSTNEYQ
jgi:hypothetical protein